MLRRTVLYPRRKAGPVSSGPAPKTDSSFRAGLRREVRLSVRQLGFCAAMTTAQKYGKDDALFAYGMSSHSGSLVMTS
jgi:hypothetical protein